MSGRAAGGSAGDVVVVGGGLAGIAAALRLADAGRRVTLLEGSRRLGGLTHSFRRGDLDVDNGQHVFLRCCTAYRGLLDRLNVTDRVHLQPRLDIPVRSATTGARARLRRLPLPAPLHLSRALAGYRPMSPAERLRFARAALALRRVDPSAPATDEESFGSWLARHGQSRRAIEALWDLVGVATLNAPAERASLALAATVFQIGLLTDPAAADLGWSLVPLHRLHAEPAAAALAAVGVRVHTSVRVRELAAAGEGWLLRGDAGAAFEAGAVVLAVPPPAAAALLPPGSVALPEGWAAGLGSAPIINVHVVYDRPVLHTPFLAGLDTPVQWVFDRTAQSGLTRGQYVAASLSAADELVDLPVAELRRRLLPQFEVLLPDAADATICDFFVTRERHATFRPAPGTARLRPGPVTAYPGLCLAGAWTDTGWPATMEGAVRSGQAAAGVLLASPARTPSEVPA